MINMYDFITANASYFDQLKFGKGGDIFIDYLCPITDPRSQVWTHKNCLMYVMQGVKEYASLEHYHRSKEGEVLFFRKGGYLLTQHFAKPYRALIFMFNDEAIRSLLIEYPHLLTVDPASKTTFLNTSKILPLESPDMIKSLFSSALMYISEPATESPVALELKFKELMVNLLRRKENNDFYLYLSWIVHEKDIPFMKLMKENSHLNFTVEELAKTANMSLSSFKRFFKKQFNLSPGQWLHEQRMARAKHMLKDLHKSISDVAFELGYSDVASFSKAFKADVGYSPSDFLKAELNEPNN